MPAKPPTNATIDHDPAALVALVEDLAARGAGWINIVPEIPEGTEVPATPNALAIFSKRGPVIPLGTWNTPANAKSGAARPRELGIQHGTSKRAADVLAGTPGALPEGWRVLSDHPKRGMVVELAPTTSTLDAATWLLNALKVLCLPPHTGNFLTLAYAA